MTEIKYKEMWKLFWELLGHKLNYYYAIPSKYLRVSQISDKEYDLKEQRYVDLRREIEPGYEYDIVGFPEREGKWVLAEAVGKFKELEGRFPTQLDWSILKTYRITPWVKAF